MPQLPGPLDALLERQHGLFTRRQAYACGLTEEVLRSNVRAGRWRHLRREVYAVFTGRLHPQHREWFAVLSAGEGALLSHDTAAHHHGLVAARPDEPHVLIPFERRISSLPGCRVHRTRSLRTAICSPPMTTVPDTLCDLATSGFAADRLAAAVASALQRGTTSQEAVLRAISERGRFRGVGLLRDLVGDAAEGAHSPLEIRFLRDVERAHDLPRGERQSRVRREGRVMYRDVHYGPFGVTVELDGREHHGSFAARLRDQRRDRLAAAAGELTLRYGWSDVAGSPCAVAAELTGVLRERGWQGAATFCRFCGV